MRESRNTKADERLDRTLQQEQETDKKTKVRIRNIKSEREEDSLRPKYSIREISNEKIDTQGNKSRWQISRHT